MPIKNRKGEIISEKDVQIFGKMLKESLENHATEAEVGIGMLNENQKEVGRAIIRNYRKAASSVGATMEALAKGKKSVSVEEAFRKTFTDVYEKSKKECRSTERSDFEVAFFMLVQPTGDESQRKYYETYPKEPQNDESIITKLADEFHLAIQPMPGVSELTDYNPASDRVVGLGESRMATPPPTRS